MQKTYLFALLLIAFSFAGKAQLMNDSVLIDGNYRSFHYNQPLKPLSMPSLMFILHGSGGHGTQMMAAAKKLDDVAANENLIIVYPDGYKNFWNECRRMSTAAANVEDVDEGKFFSAMINYFEKNYGIDTGKVLAAGMSGGGHMCYKLALTMPGKIKAITAVVANLPDSANMDCVASGKPVSVMIVNGTADQINPYKGGEVKIPNVKLGTVMSTDATFAYWATLDGYKGKPAEKELPDNDPADGKRVVKYEYRKTGKPAVVLLKVINGKHDYPGDIDTYMEAWNFFKEEMKRKAAGDL